MSRILPGLALLLTAFAIPVGASSMNVCDGEMDQDCNNCCTGDPN